MSAFTPPEVWCARTADDVKVFPVEHSILSPDIFSATSGPGSLEEFICSLVTDEDTTNNNAQPTTEPSKSCRVRWSHPNRKACGRSISLYDRNPVSGKVSGDPIADCFACLARKNNSLMVIADGVNWGERSKIAAKCAVNAAIHHLHNALFVDLYTLRNTKEAFRLMREAFDVAQESIIKHRGGLTTLNITMVLPIQDSTQHAVCSVNVGDSLAYVFSKRYGMNELSVGSHDINVERDMKDVGGAIGAGHADLPYLANLTFSLTTCEPGDIVFLTTDGISDNFDPVVINIAVPGRRDSLLQSVDHKAEMLPHERHLFTTKGMERVIHEYELDTGLDISARELCSALAEHVIGVTKQKRSVLENPVYYRRQYKSKERKRIEDSIRKTLRSLPGKLDHATVVAYEAGLYRDESSPNTRHVYSAIASDSTSNQSSSTEPSTSVIFETDV